MKWFSVLQFCVLWSAFPTTLFAISWLKMYMSRKPFTFYCMHSFLVQACGLIFYHTARKSYSVAAIKQLCNIPWMYCAASFLFVPSGLLIILVFPAFFLCIPDLQLRNKPTILTQCLCLFNVVCVFHAMLSHPGHLSRAQIQLCTSSSSPKIQNYNQMTEYLIEIVYIN